ncbi:SCO family protein [Microtetraspora sp. NBRC 13810]|nr:SCO family protein [Microtetraspora sp. NBRC 13810]
MAGLLLLGLLTGCATGTTTGAASSPVRIVGPTSDFHGVWLDQPLPQPDVTLTDTSGKPFSLRTGTAGRLTLTYFGYTHCPDICPTTMADLSAALRQLTPADRKRIAVVFVTTDPDRDTPEVIRSWLASFDKSFIGLTGDYAKIRAAARTVGIGLEQPASKSGDYEVTHGAQVIAFDDTHRARLIFTSGTSPSDYAADLPRLLARVTLNGTAEGES